MGIAGSTSAMWQFWLAQKVKYTAAGCPPCRDDDNNVIPCPNDNLFPLFPHYWRSKGLVRSFLETRPLAIQGFRLSVAGLPDRTYRLQAANTLPPTNWIDLLTFTLDDPRTNVIDATARIYPQRFYRIVSP
jgi:hypothetical protein